MNDFELNFIESFSVVDYVFVGFIQLAEFRGRVLDQNLFIGMDKFGFSPVSCAHLEVGTVLLNTKNSVAIEELHGLIICC